MLENSIWTALLFLVVLLAGFRLSGCMVGYEPRVAHPRSQVSRLHAPLPGWRARLLLLAFSAGRVPFQSAADRPRGRRFGPETRAWLCTAQASDWRKKKCRARASVCSYVYCCRGRGLSQCTLHTLENIWCCCCYVSMSFTYPSSPGIRLYPRSGTCVLPFSCGLV